MSDYKYYPSLRTYKRRESRVINIGDVPCGGNYPIRVQSMTVSETMNTEATVAESIRMVQSGSEYVRITAPSIREAENLKAIKDALRKKGVNVPLIADIHFTPNAAEAAARIVEKVRVNPGNYADRKKFQTIEYTEQGYQEELERIYERFTPLVKVCKEYGTAMRIGTNHGSLSDRILSRYGDTPNGMVESAMEFIRICEDLNYYDIVLSMKSSNPQVMVQAYRLLVKKMDDESMNYPLHLGVTEAGEGEEGRIKSAMGIGTLLEDGLGDTIRVSLTEPAEFEAPVGIKITSRYKNRPQETNGKVNEVIPINPFEYRRRDTGKVHNFGKSEVPRVIADFHNKSVGYLDLKQIGYVYNAQTDKWNIADQSADYIYLGSNLLDINVTPQLGLIYDYEFWTNLEDKTSAYPLFTPKNIAEIEYGSDVVNFLEISVEDFNLDYARNIENTILVLKAPQNDAYKRVRNVFFELVENNIEIPVIVKSDYPGLDEEDVQLHSAIESGGLLVDGFGDGLWMTPTTDSNIRIAFGILQASRTRISKTEYISCPSCGRTLFDLQETSAKIRAKTNHLKGVKIGIMGCIVNGPGEMADADYGYVGTGIGKISLYRKHTVVKKNIASEHAVDALIDLIKEDGNWIEAPVQN